MGKSLSLSVSPVSHRADQGWSIRNLDAPVGAEALGVDASRPVPAEQILAMKRALADRGALVLRGQQLDDEAFIRFATCFGAFYHPGPGERVMGLDQFSGDLPNIVRVSNFDGELGRYELAPHIDHHWTQVPSSGSLAYAVEVPSNGGDTSCHDLVAAYQALDADTQREIDGLQLITYNPYLRLRRRDPHVRGIPRYRTPDIEPAHTGVTHPLVRTHPINGRKLIFLGSDNEVEVVGVDPADGQALIERLRAHIQEPRFTYTHHWQVGDILYWDNQGVLHGRNAFPATERRTLKRISLAGSRPF